MEERRRLWCPGCQDWVEPGDPGVLVDFGPQSFRITMDGMPDFGPTLNETFLDYNHLSCGAQVRMSTGSGWDEEAGDYLPVGDAHLEIYIGDEYVQTTDSLFSGAVSDDPEHWGPTLVALTEMYRSAVDKMMSKLEGDD